MGKRTNSGVNLWRAGCGESRTSGSEGGSEKPTCRKADRALRPDPYTKLRGPAKGVYYDPLSSHRHNGSYAATRIMDRWL
jgi:hypothetical protein